MRRGTVHIVRTSPRRIFSSAESSGLATVVIADTTIKATATATLKEMSGSVYLGGWTQLRDGVVAIWHYADAYDSKTSRSCISIT